MRTTIAAIVVLALAGCGGSEVRPEATAEVVDPAVAAKEVRALADYCTDRRLEGRADGVMGNTQRITILDAASVYTERPTNELRAALQDVGGCSPATDDVVRTALAEAGR